MAVYTNPPTMPNLRVEDSVKITGLGYHVKLRLQTGRWKVQLWGAQGGGSQINGNGNLGVGGAGAYVEGYLDVDSDEGLVLYAFAGMMGNASNAGTTGNAWPGGGSSSASSFGEPAGGGGGATDLRLQADENDKTAWSMTQSLRSRIAVAAGGGGGGDDGEAGGPGGALTGVAGKACGAQLVTQTSGYGFGVAMSSVSDGGAAGCGYYGGRVVSSSVGFDLNGGPGANSFISGFAGCNAVNANGAHTGQPVHYSGISFLKSKMIAGNATQPSPSGGTQVGNAGNGVIIVTYINETPGSADTYPSMTAWLEANEIQPSSKHMASAILDGRKFTAEVWKYTGSVTLNSKEYGEDNPDIPLVIMATGSITIGGDFSPKVRRAGLFIWTPDQLYVNAKIIMTGKGSYTSAPPLTLAKLKNGDRLIIPAASNLRTDVIKRATQRQSEDHGSDASYKNNIINFACGSRVKSLRGAYEWLLPETRGSGFAGGPPGFIKRRGEVVEFGVCLEELAGTVVLFGKNITFNSNGRIISQGQNAREDLDSGYFQGDGGGGMAICLWSSGSTISSSYIDLGHVTPISTPEGKTGKGLFLNLQFERDTV